MSRNGVPNGLSDRRPVSPSSAAPPALAGGAGNRDDVPFLAGQAIRLVNVRGKAGDTTRVVVTGETECEGEVTTKTVARVRRLR